MKTPIWYAIVLAIPALAQQPHVANARVETRPVAGSLDATMRSILAAQSAPAWVGYAEPIIPGDRQSCCWSDNQRGCFLEPHSNGQTITDTTREPVMLEGPSHVVVLFRIENRLIGKIRTFTPDCELDAGGLDFIWLANVNAAESVAYLQKVAQSAAANGGREEARRADGAVFAIAMHADPAAEQALERILGEDPSDKLREQAIFGLTQRRDARSLDAVVRAARDDKSPQVRGQALFWLAQRATQTIAQDAISNAIANDPETEVKKKAVFALTQIPKGDGVPALIQVARTNRNAAVRKQAMFWLGQSKDPRALAYFEEVLK
jgi:HEAT repeats